VVSVSQFIVRTHIMTIICAVIVDSIHGRFSNRF